MLVGNSHFARGDEHAAALDPADRADLEIEAGAGDMRARPREHRHHAGTRVGRAAHDLHRLAVAGLDHADFQLVGVRMLLGGDDARDREGRELLRLVLDALDFEADHGELVDDLIERSVGVEMLLQPGEGELHSLSPPASVGKSSGRKP